MGLSLRKIGDAIGGVASGVARQVNPFDNGATYSNPVARGPVPDSIVNQVNRTVNPYNNNSNVSQFVGGSVRGIEDMAKAGVRSLYDIGRGAAASGDIPFTNPNPTALFNANQAKATDFPQFLAPLTRPFVQAAETIVHPTSKHTFTPTTQDEQQVLGTTPIQNIQAGVASNYEKTHNPLEAGAYGAGQVALDAAAIYGAKAGIKGAQKPIVRGLDNRVPLNEIGAVGKDVNGNIKPESQTIAYHGSTNDKLTSLTPGAKTDLNEKRNLVYLTEDKKTAGDYTKARGAGGLGVLKDSPTGKVYPVQVHGKVLDAYDHAELTKLANAPGAERLGKIRNTLTNDTGLSADILEANPELRQFLSNNGVTAVRTHLPNGGGATQLAVINTDKINLAKPTVTAKIPPRPITLKQPTASEVSMGKALGMSKDDVMAAKNPPPLETATPNSNPVNLSELSPQEQMALSEPKTQLAPAEVNTAANPFKADIPSVAKGDYKQVISNEMAASEPVKFAGDRWTAAMKNLNPDEQTNFWKAVEKPDDPSYSPQLKQAIATWRDVDNRIHGTSQSLGGNTNYLKDHNLHPWDLPPEFTDHVVNGGDPSKFPGLNNLSRKYQTIAEGEANGLKLGADPVGEGSNYINASAALLKRRAIVKGLAEADSGVMEKSHAFDIGGGNSIPVSRDALKAVKGLQRSTASDNAVIKGARTVNTGFKSSILSAGQFHPINIAALRAAPTLALKGHPIAAAKGLGRTFRVLGPGGTAKVERVLQKALDDGMVDKAAKIGMPYSAGGFDAEGSFLKGGVGHKTVFGKQMPMMHDQVVRSIVHDLERKNIPLDSPEARAAGKAGNNLMGFVNKETQNIPPAVNRGLGDLLLAKQFTHSKFSQAGTALTKGGVAGSYARANIAANVAATTAVIAGIGYLGKQKSDDTRDLFLRALIDPAAPTGMTDKKGNTVKLRTPGTDTSDIAKLLGMKLVRNSDGHLGVNWQPGNMPSTVEEYLRARLSPFLSAGVKEATNTTFAGQPMYDPNAPAGTKAIQSAVSIGTGLLPIGAQGLAFTGPVKNALGGSAKAVLDAQTPGSNPVVKSIGSSFGITPTTDMTTGKGLQSSQYFDALSTAKDGLNSHEKDALDLYAGSKKNPVTGAYDVQPNANDTQAKARALLDQPKVIDHLVTLNQSLTAKGQATDPLFSATKDQITKVLQYQAMPPGDANRTHWEAQNGSWYNPLAAQRSTFFGSLPTGDPNKPQAPIQYPNATPAVADAQKQFFAITDATQRAQFLQAHPEVQQQLDAQVAYTNKMREATGYSALDTYPTATPAVQKIINTYNAIPTGGGSKGGNLYRSQWITSHPQEYAAMSNYYTQASLYGLNKEAGQAQFQDTGPSQKYLKDAYSLGQYDIVKNKDGTYSLGSSYGSSGSGGAGGYSSSGHVSRTAAELQNPYFDAVDIDAGGKKSIGKASKPKVTKSTGGGYKSKPGGYQPKVSMKLPGIKSKLKLKVSRV